VIVLPDTAGVVRLVLLASSDVTALIGTRVATTDPSATTPGWVRLVETGGLTPVRQGLEAGRIDLNCYGATHPAASLLARTCKAVLLDARNVHTTAGWFAGADVVVGIQDLTDPIRNIPRRIFSISAFTRPL